MEYNEFHHILAVRGDERHPCRLQVGGTYRAVEWELESPLGTLTCSGSDTIELLTKVRVLLESQGWLLAVQGARRDAHASGMLRDMGDGKRVYLITDEPGPYDAADTLAPAEPEQVTTLGEQSQFVREWLRTWRARRGRAADRQEPELSP